MKENPAPASLDDSTSLPEWETIITVWKKLCNTPDWKKKWATGVTKVILYTNPEKSIEQPLQIIELPEAKLMIMWSDPNRIEYHDADKKLFETEILDTSLKIDDILETCKHIKFGGTPPQKQQQQREIPPPVQKPLKSTRRELFPEPFNLKAHKKNLEQNLCDNIKEVNAHLISVGGSELDVYEALLLLEQINLQIISFKDLCKKHTWKLSALESLATNFESLSKQKMIELTQFEKSLESPLKIKPTLKRKELDLPPMESPIKYVRKVVEGLSEAEDSTEIFKTQHTPPVVNNLIAFSSVFQQPSSPIVPETNNTLDLSPEKKTISVVNNISVTKH